MEKKYSRRKFLTSSSLLIAGATLGLQGIGMPGSEPVIDIHQHIHYHGRTDKQMLAHQRAMGVTQTILLPAGSRVNRASTYWGTANGLGGVGAGGNEACYQFAQKHSGEFIFGANEVSDLPGATQEIEKYLKRGAPIIGELKFGVACDSPGMQAIYKLARSYDVPVLMHWQYHKYNYGFERFYTMLEKYPKVKFIGHAQTWWANVDKNYKDPTVMYPKGKMTPGGLTDRLLSEYPNMYSDLSAGSCLNFLLRDEDFTRDFLQRHQDKLMFGSDCADKVGKGKACDGAQIIATVRRLSPSKKIERKLLYENAKNIFQLS